MKQYGIKRTFTAVLCAVFLLVILGIFCYMNVSPVDAVTGATPGNVGLQEDGAILHLVHGESR